MHSFKFIHWHCPPPKQPARPLHCLYFWVRKWHSQLSQLVIKWWWSDPLSLDCTTLVSVMFRSVLSRQDQTSQNKTFLVILYFSRPVIQVSDLTSPPHFAISIFRKKFRPTCSAIHLLLPSIHSINFWNTSNSADSHSDHLYAYAVTYSVVWSLAVVHCLFFLKNLNDPSLLEFTIKPTFITANQIALHSSSFCLCSANTKISSHRQNKYSEFVPENYPNYILESELWTTSMSVKIVSPIMARASVFAYFICRKFSKWAKHHLD